MGILGPGYRPGQTVPADPGAVCETCGVPTTLALVGETDSFGSETIELCQRHLDESRTVRYEGGICDWCSLPAIELIPTKDVDEGSNGRLYQVCHSCREEQNRRCEADIDDAYHGGID